RPARRPRHDQRPGAAAGGRAARRHHRSRENPRGRVPRDDREAGAMTAAVLRAELFKQRTTRTTLGLFATMLGLVLLAELLHGYGLPAKDIGSARRQLQLLAPGEIIGTLLAALLGAMSITGEIRHGTIRPTLLVSPD